MFKVTIALLLCLMAPSSADLSCLDNDGNKVGWWFMYKLPNGFKFAYSDENYQPSSATKLDIFETEMDNTTHPVALTRTLLSLLGPDGEAEESSSKTPFLMYNDQPDNGNPGANYGHTKGVFSPNNFFLMHSTPHFPSSSGKRDFFFPDSETIYGQTFLCVTLTRDADTETIAKHMLYTSPYVYYDNIPSSLTTKYPTLGRVLDKDWIQEAGTVTGKIKSGSKTFTFFGKNDEWDDDLYEGLVAPGLDANLVVETWLRGSKEGSYCKPKHKYEVLDINAMQVTDLEGNTQTWHETQDHAKWCITTDPTGSRWVCVADINRMTTQRNRGGGAVCFQQASLVDALGASIASQNKCRSRSSKSFLLRKELA